MADVARFGTWHWLLGPVDKTRKEDPVVLLSAHIIKRERVSAVSVQCP